jgi:hypothetical protein
VQGAAKMNISYPMKTRPLAGMTMVALLMCLTACTAVDEQAKQQAATRKARQETAMRMWKERCETKAGEKIYRTVDNVEGIFLMKIRPSGVMNYGDQFRMDDPYGSDVTGDGYIRSFLKGHDSDERSPDEDLTHLPNGFRYVETRDAQDGRIYRYTGRIEEPWLTNKAYLKGYTRFVLDKVPVMVSTARYGITYDDMSTLGEREYWIAGSSLRVVDLQSNDVIAERIGYMVDWAQGSLAGGRSPWLFAADNACPYFAQRHGALAQLGQTARFVEKVLKPSK